MQSKDLLSKKISIDSKINTIATIPLRKKMRE